MPPFTWAPERPSLHTRTPTPHTHTHTRTRTHAQSHTQKFIKTSLSTLEMPAADSFRRMLSFESLSSAFSALATQSRAHTHGHTHGRRAHTHARVCIRHQYAHTSILTNTAPAEPRATRHDGSGALTVASCETAPPRPHQPWPPRIAPHGTSERRPLPPAVLIEPVLRPRCLHRRAPAVPRA